MTGTGGGAGDGAGGGSGGGGVGGAGAGGGSSTAGNRKFCPGSLTPTPFSDVGDACGAGSNLALCAITGSTQCSTGLCLWDSADPVGDRAYCTIACHPGTAGTCPDGFECRTESCAQMQICVRTQVPPTTPPGLAIQDAAFPSNYTPFGLGMLGDKAYWLASNGIAYERAADGTVRALSGTVAGGLRDVSALVDGDSLLLRIDGTDYMLGRIANGTLTTRTFDLSMRGIFRGQDGVAYMLEADVFTGNAQLAPVTADLMPSPDTSRYINLTAASGLSPSDVWPLRDYGFVGTCWKGATLTETVACASADGRTIADLGSATVDGSIVRQSFRPDRVWMPIPGGFDVPSELALWNGTTWTKEALMADYGQLVDSSSEVTIQGVLPLSPTDDRVMVFIGDTFTTQAAYAAGPCYMPLYRVGSGISFPFSRTGGVFSLLETAPDAATWSDDGLRLITLRASAFPTP